MTTKAISLAVVALVVGATSPACISIVRACEQGNWVAMDATKVPASMHVGQTIIVSALYGSGTPETGEDCDKTLYTSAERPDAFSYASTDSTIVVVTKLGGVTAVAAGTASIYAIANGLTSKHSLVTVTP